MTGRTRNRDEGGLEAVISLMVRGFTGQELEVEFVVDTGFSGDGSLTDAQVELLGMPQSGAVDSTLADGSARQVPVYTAIVVWDGIERLVSLIGGDKEPLVGMTLMQAYNLSIDVVDDGAVQLTRLA